MHNDLNAFFMSQGASIKEDNALFFADTATDNTISALPHLAVLTVSGKDAAVFLQGQATCNIKEVTETQGSFGAFCTAKGRVMASFFIIRRGDSYRLLLAQSLIEKVCKKLRMYVLRADVKLDYEPPAYAVLGLQTTNSLPGIAGLSACQAVCLKEHIFIRLPGTTARHIIISPVDQLAQLWTELVAKHNLTAVSTSKWQVMDIQSGIAWLDAETTEEYTPQMLNLDQLHGISFNKGCYTGQEVIARTHYKGAAKRHMYLAVCDTPETHQLTNIRKGDSILQQNVSKTSTAGHVLNFIHEDEQLYLLLVLQISSAVETDLYIDAAKPVKLAISTFSYQ